MPALILFVAIALTAFTPAANAAEIVKCTNADGSVIFTAAPCPDEATSETLDIKTRPSDPQAVAERHSRREETLKKIEEREETAAEAAAVKAKEEALRKRKCEQARRNAEKLAMARRVTREENGEHRYLTEDEIAERKRTNQQRIAEFCD